MVYFMNSNTILWLNPANISPIYNQYISFLQSDLQLNFQIFKTLPSCMDCICKSTEDIKAILNLEDIISDKSFDIYEIVQSMTTLTKIRGSSIILGINVSSNADIKFIKYVKSIKA